MSDRDIIEVAAKAVGIVGTWVDRGCDDRGQSEGLRLASNCNYIWNPLDRDDDALDLASRSKLTIDFERGIIWGAGSLGKTRLARFKRGEYKRAITFAAANGIPDDEDLD